MKNSSTLFLALISMAFFIACNKDSEIPITTCRDCTVFDTALSFWRHDTEAINDNITYIGLGATSALIVNDIKSNEAFESCETSDEVLDITCQTSKEFLYTFGQLFISYSEEFINTQSATENTTQVNYKFSWYANDTIYQTTINLLDDPIALKSQFEILPVFEQNGISYNEVLKLEITEVLNLSTLELEPPSIINRLYFKEGIGLIGIREKNDIIYIRQK